MFLDPPMIEQLLPDTVVAVDTREDLLDSDPYPEEQASIVNAVEKRRREFVTVRTCARMALRRLGLPPQAIPSGEHGEPRWPDGVVGSITHCDGYRACALARGETVLTVGIDAEPNAPLPDGVLEAIVRPEERPPLEELRKMMPSVHWDRLLFSAKESVYKAWFPVARRWLGFEDAIVGIELSGEVDRQVKGVRRCVEAPVGVFHARLLVVGPSVEKVFQNDGTSGFVPVHGAGSPRDVSHVPPVRASTPRGAQLGPGTPQPHPHSERPSDGRQLTGFSGRWLVRDGLVVTAVVVQAPVPSAVAR